MAELVDAYEMTPLQAGMLFHSLHKPESGAYFEQCWCVLEGPLEAERFRLAWQKVIDRHGVLRSECRWEGHDNPVQLIYDTAEPVWEIMDWTVQADPDAAFAEWLVQDRRRGFQLDQAPLMRFALMQLGADRCRFVWSFHHLLMDGWCGALLVREMLRHYKGAVLPQEPAPYRNYVEWRAEQDVTLAEAHWRQTMAGLEAPTPLGIDRHMSGCDGIVEIRETLSPAFVDEISSMARGARLTLNTVMQGAWALILSRYSSDDDVLFGAVQSGRPPELAGVEDMIGLFLNTVPVRVKTDPERKLIDWLQELQSTQRDRERFGHVALTDIQQWSDIASPQPLFDSLLIVENYPLSIEHAFANENVDLTVKDAGSFERTNYPLTIKILPGQIIDISLTIDTARIEPAAAERLMVHFKTVLGAFVRQANDSLGEIEIMDGPERDILLRLGQGHIAEAATAVHEQIVAQAELSPQAIAVEFEGDQGNTSLTYGEFVRKGEAVAARLIQLGAGPGTIVAFCLERSPELLLSLFGVLRSGAAYIPIDPSYPIERINHVLEDSGARLALVDDVCADKLVAISNVEIIQINDCLSQDFSAPAVPVTAENLAYMIYTSGSTGRPKGVPIRHGSLSNFMQSMALTPGITADDRLLAVTTVAFDIAALELLGPLSQGGTVVFADADRTRSGTALIDMMERQNITVMQATPAGWRMLIEAGWTGRSGLKMLCGGEALDSMLARELLKRGEALWNLYGPTETAIWSGAVEITPDLLNEGNAPVGGPIDNTGFRLLDTHGRAVPVGVPGELHISGEGLSPGYHCRPELTAEKFVTARDGTRLYRTGDSMRYREDGSLEFLGRLDGQIKLRGFRIELGEIEARIASHASIAQAVAVVRDDGTGAYIAAYLRANKATEPLSHDELHSYLASALPDYMIPGAFVWLDDFPLTPNGKIDRKALPAPEQRMVVIDNQQNVFVELIGEIWAEALGQPAVSTDDNFFHLGGHSLLATRILGQVQRATGIACNLRDLFEAPVLADFCKRLDIARGVEALPRLLPAPANTAPAVSFAQTRQWLIAKFDPESPAYLIPVGIRLRGTLSREALERALNELAARHDVLRSAFSEFDGEAALTIAPSISVPLSFEDISHLGLADREAAIDQIRQNEVQQTFDLTRAPLWRARLLHLAADEHVLLLTLHHILADEWSLEIILKDLGEAYGKALAGLESQPKPLTQYQDYARWQRDLDLDGQLQDWCDFLADAPVLLPLPTDHPRPMRREPAGAAFEFSLSAEASAALRQMARRNGVTLFMLLAAAYVAVLQRHTDSDDIVVGTPVTNRSAVEVQGLVGLFVNTLALRVDLHDNPDFSTLLERVRETVLFAHARQDVPFEQVLDALNLPRSSGHQPLFQVLFSLQTLPEAGKFHDDLEWQPLPTVSVSSKFDLALAWRETPDGLRGRFEYPLDLFNAQTVERFAGRIGCLLDALPEQLDVSLDELPILPDEELALLDQWAHGPATASRYPTLQASFAAQARATPLAPALSSGELQINYATLLDRVSTLAARLECAGVGRGDRIGLWVDQSVDTLVALLAILWRGAAYVPLDIGYPLERLRWMVFDADIRLTLAAMNGPLPDVNCPVIRLSDVTVETGSPIPPVEGNPEDIAYILYTSGSTGRPKGVCTPHRGVLRLVTEPGYVTLSAGEVLLQAAPLTFDASTFEVFGALLNGGRLVLTEEGDGSLTALGQTIADQGVTTLWLTAGLFHLMAEESPEILVPLRQLLAGGDRVSLAHVRKMQALAPHLRIINGYGPTETTTFACCYTIPADGGWASEGSPAIGKPINGTELHILDKRGTPVPPGVPGELYIGGEGLARGYLNRAELTAERFLPNPFTNPRAHRFGDPETCLYRTGDRVRFTPDGTLLYLGRLDDQVKIRGFRIEPGEIEAALISDPAIRSSVVIVDERNGTSRRLVAYLVKADTSQAPTDAQLRNYLLGRLPEYMIPAHFVWLDALPLTANGKMDRKSLPDVTYDGFSDAPEGEIEKTLADIWVGIFRVDAVGRTDNFFDLGGDSILAMQIVSRARNAGLLIEPRHLFEYQTIAGLAGIATTVSSSNEQPLGPVELLEEGAIDMEALLASVSFGARETEDS